MKMKLFIVLLFLPYISAFLDFPSYNLDLYDRFMHSLTPPKVNATLVDGSFCDRECKPNDQKFCHFHWVLEHYHVMGGACNDCTDGNTTDCFHSKCVLADGFERGLMTINRQLPGPPINVCKDDMVVVDVHNEMDGTSTSIHWHGINQVETPHMDGVPYVTQCPIQYGSIFRYAFYVRETGTNFYHSHSGLHKTNGLYGALVVREPKKQDRNKKFYDYDLAEHVIVASDWMHDYAEMFAPGLSSRLSLYQSLLINGHGRFYDQSTATYKFSPYEVFFVEPGKKYRFRFINSASNICPLVLKIEQHQMNVVATEADAVKPLIIDTILTVAGERYDFVIEANQSPKNYWIRMRSMGPCESLKIETFAVLSYGKKLDKSSDEYKEIAFNMSPPSFEDNYPDNVFLNDPKAKTFGPKTNAYTIANLKTYIYRESLIAAYPDNTFNLFFGTPRMDNKKFFSGPYHHFMSTSDVSNFNNVGTINNISLIYPTIPLLTQAHQINEELFCNQTFKPKTCNEVEPCFCQHRIKVKLNAIVEFLIVDITEQIGPMLHPFHLHGHSFVVQDIGIFPKDYTLEQQKKSKPDGFVGKAFPLKDTILIPSRGFVRIKFRANNPGFWMVHCHYEPHLSIGMGMILQVGEAKDMVKTPKDFPTCNDYKPKIAFP